MIKNIFGLIVLWILLDGCSTKAYLPKQNSLEGKRVALGMIDITRQKRGKILYNDTICACITQSIAETLYPYLQKAGAIIVNMTLEQRTNELRISQAADSLQVDYLLSGTGITQRTGSTDFMEQLNLKLVSVHNKTIILTGSFAGPSVTPAGAAKRIGKKILKQ